MGSREHSAETDWDFYFCNVNNALSSIMVDLGANRRAPVADKPWLLWVWVHLRSPRHDCLSSDEEAPKLYEIEDSLTDGLCSASGAELLGRITGNDRREFYFYSRSTDILRPAVVEVRRKFPDYTIECGAQHDPDWRQYRDVLYPSATDMQRIQNRRVVDELAKRGDNHSMPRNIDHAIYFRRAEDRRAFIALAIGAGFTVQSERDDGAVANERPFFLNLVRTDRVTVEHIDQVVVELLELAERFDADYDGWGCEVVQTANTGS